MVDSRFRRTTFQRAGLGIRTPIRWTLGNRPLPTSAPRPPCRGATTEPRAIPAIAPESHRTQVRSARSADTHASRLEEGRDWLRNRHHLAVEAAALIVVYLVYASAAAWSEVLAP